MTIEIETKFVIPNQTIFAELQAVTQLGAFNLQPQGVKQTVDRYLDTATQAVMQGGFACRLRQSKGGTQLTLKALTAADGALHRRQEVEATLDQPTIDPQAWPDSEAKTLLLSLIGTATLVDLFTIRQNRVKAVVLQTDVPIIELSLDQVFLTATGSQPDYLELEAELLSTGSETQLTEFVQQLRQRWSLEAESRSKFERAWAMVNQ